MTPPVTLGELAAADARLAAFFSGRRGLLLILFGLTMTLGGLWGAALLQIQNPARQFDFQVFWGTARLALAGEPLAAFDMARLTEASGAENTTWLPWLYAPGFMMILAPFGALPRVWAWIAFGLLSAMALWFALRPYNARLPVVTFAMVAAPAMASAYMQGQNSLLWLALCLAAFAALRSGRPLLAGALIGVLTLKPQLCLMIPFALLGLWAWRAILAAGLSTLAVAALPTLIVGTGYWTALQGNLAAHAEFMETWSVYMPDMFSPLSMLLRAGLGMDLAKALQTAIAVALAGVVWWAWRQRFSFDLKLAMLLAAMTLATPYFWFYDAGALALAGLFLVRAGVLDTGRAGTAFFVWIWLGAAPGTLAHGAFPLIEVRDLLAPAAMATFAVCLYACIREARSASRTNNADPSAPTSQERHPA